jgi:hypothetical protein
LVLGDLAPRERDSFGGRSCHRLGKYQENDHGKQDYEHDSDDTPEKSAFSPSWPFAAPRGEIRQDGVWAWLFAAPRSEIWLDGVLTYHRPLSHQLTGDNTLLITSGVHPFRALDAGTTQKPISHWYTLTIKQSTFSSISHMADCHLRL